MRPDRIGAAITDQADAPPILTAAWRAVLLRVQLAPADAWHDAEHLADDVADFLDCRADLVDQVIAAAVDMGRLRQRTTRHDRLQVQPQTPGRTRDRNPRRKQNRR